MDAGSKLWPGLSLEPLAREGGELHVIVRYQPSAERVVRAQTVAGATLRRHYRTVPFVAMRVSATGLRQLQEDPAVERVWPDLPVRAWLDRAVPLVHVPEVWLSGYTGRNVRIGIIDTGIDPNHPDLDGRIADSVDMTGEGPRDGNGHGTHVAGIAAGSGAASDGKYRGVAPDATLYVAKVLGSDGGGMTSDVIAGLEWAAQQEVHVINLSLGSSGSSDGTDALSVACDTIMARGIAVCVAAGNEGPDNYTVGSPGAAQQVITVGACTLDGQVADFSSRGPTADGRAKPDIVLPGVNITSCRAAGTSLGATIDAHYTVASGTSMATPMATGIVALLVEAFPGLRSLELKERLKRTAVDLGLTPYGQGAGRCDAMRAYKDEAGNPPSTPPLPPPPPPKGCLTSPAEILRTLLRPS